MQDIGIGRNSGSGSFAENSIGEGVYAMYLQVFCGSGMGKDWGNGSGAGGCDNVEFGSRDLE